MAPTLTSNSFLLTTTPHSISRHSLRIYAKSSGPFSPFQLAKSNSDSESESESKSGNSSPFRFNFGRAADVKSLIPIVSNPASGISFRRRKDPATVFVAGATGQAGIRIAQTLLREGFIVRAGVPELGAAQDLARFAASYKIISKDESKRLNAVESAFKDAESIAKAIGNASKVVVTIGPTENGPTSEVSASDALQVIEAAQLAGVGHVAIIYDSNTGTSTYNVLDGLTTFFNNIFSKSQELSIPEFLQKVIETDVSYTFIKASLTEDFSEESSYNVVVSAEGSIGENDFKVAKSQIASIVAKVFSNTAVAENKVVEIFTNPSAPAKSLDELFSAIPEDGRRKVYAESVAKKKEEEEARGAAVAAEEVKEVKEVGEAEGEENAASMENLLSRAKEMGTRLSWEKLSSQIGSAVQNNTNDKPEAQIATVRGQAKARALPAQKAVVKRPSLKLPSFKPKQAPNPKPKAEKAEPKGEVKKLFGGLFQQETIYIDDE
ncbi:protein PLASTID TRANSCRIPTIONALLY ACTIVE 16, chloroplastic [Euphorbia lathyris]|uniref:protein PLASTID TRANSCRIPTIONALLY ACTIVE 16, chloroplastic n=1 Tax=Euphorbia lathyris TaxID=212925 RepID=UPI0033139B1B